MAISRPELEIALGNHFEVVRERSTREEIVIICPTCPASNPDRSGNRSVNVKTLKSNCWRCNIGGSIFSLAREAGIDLDLAEDVQRSASLQELDDLMAALDKPAVKPTGYVPSVELPRGFTPLSRGPELSYHRLIAKMAARKRLPYEALVTAGVGYTRESRRWEPFAIFPCFEWSRPVYYQGRTYVDTPGESTKLFPSRQECPLSSRYWVYNIDKLRGGGKVALAVEAVLSVLSLEIELAKRGIDNVVPVAVYKHHLSHEQMTKLLACRPAEVCIMYDGDSYTQGVKDALRLVNNVKASAVKLWDTDKRRKDPNDDAAGAVDLFLARRPVKQIDALQL